MQKYEILQFIYTLITFYSAYLAEPSSQAQPGRQAAEGERRELPANWGNTLYSTEILKQRSFAAEQHNLKVITYCIGELLF